ncbi:MAG TPA: T9SS type A sorting domain-containing protein, partial [Paludibacteraceae bacterium]|nr:T9SS type A sorting domain-containing protein [Paludibacteraceae bacterium]
ARFSYEGNGNWLVTSWATFAAKNQYSESTVGESIVSSDMIGVRIYPNPVSDYLWFDFPCTEKSSVVVSDYMGRKLIESQISSGEGISVKELQSGVYFVVLTTPNGGQSRMKVVKR